jgi:hypothetical protein
MLRRISVLAWATAATVELCASAPAGAFTATPAAMRVIEGMRAEARTLSAIRVARSGALVYCPSAPEGWTYAPAAGCRTPARVTEEYDLSRGDVERIIGHVTATHRRMFTYVVDSSGWYRSTAGSGCWTLELRGFTIAPWVDYPLPRTRVSVRQRSSRRIVLQAVTPRLAYAELDYVNPKTFFDYRDIETTRSQHRSYRVYDRSTRLGAQTVRPPTTPACA